MLVIGRGGGGGALFIIRRVMMIQHQMEQFKWPADKFSLQLVQQYS